MEARLIIAYLLIALAIAAALWLGFVWSRRRRDHPRTMYGRGDYRRR